MKLINYQILLPVIKHYSSEVNYSLNKFFQIFFSKNESKDLAVCVEGAWKNYGSWWKSTTALHDVTLHVPTGAM